MPVNHRGFTLIELMVAIAILGIFAALAVPAFTDLRERAVVRGAGDQLTSFWANARLEALKRNQSLTVNIKKNGTGGMCIGASTNSTGCDCFTSGACDVATYPSAIADWHDATAVGNPTLGADDSDAVGLATIDPKRGELSDSTHTGGITVQSSGDKRYRLRFFVDRWGRPYLCQPTDSPRPLPDYTSRTCDP